MNQGKLCARGQAGIGRTYHPDRFQQPMRRGADGTLQPISWKDAVAELAAEIGRAPGKTWLLGGEVGPALSGLLDQFVTAVGAGGRTVYEPFAPEALRGATRALFGVASVPVFDLSEADLVVDLGSDFLESGLSPTEHARQLAAARDVAAHPGGGARLVSVGPRLSMTTSNADEWIAARPGSEGILALALARVAIENGAGGPEHRALLAGLLAGFDAAGAAQKADVSAETIQRLGAALARAKRPVVLPPGVALSSRRAVDTTAAVLLLNHVLGAIGRDVQVPPASEGRKPSYRDTLALAEAMEAGSVAVLLIHDANPVYSIPKSAGFEKALAKVKLTVSFSAIPDETTEKANLILPDHTPLESWGDASPRPGVRSLIQPTIRPLYDTQALGDTLLAVGREVGAAAAGALPAGSFRSVLEAAWAGENFRAALQRGGTFAPLPALPVSLAPAALEVVAPKLTGDGSHVLVAFPHGFLYDGRGANLGWLQEIPDAVTKIAWSSWLEISPKSAEALGVEDGDFVAIETSAGRVEAQAYVRGGLRDDVVAMPIGQGHTVGWYASRASDGQTGPPRRERARRAPGRRRRERRARVADREGHAFVHGRDAPPRAAPVQRQPARPRARRGDLPGGPRRGERRRRGARRRGGRARRGGRRRARKRGAPRALRSGGGRGAGQPVPLGPVGRPGPLHRLQRVRGGLLRREQHPGGRRGRGAPGAAHVLAAHRSLDRPRSGGSRDPAASTPRRAGSASARWTSATPR